MSEKTYTIHAPNETFEGVSAGVQFKDGKGRGTLQQAAKLVLRGYSCDAAEDAVTTATLKARETRATKAAKEAISEEIPTGDDRLRDIAESRDPGPELSEELRERVGAELPPPPIGARAPVDVPTPADPAPPEDPSKAADKKTVAHETIQATRKGESR